MSEKKRMAIIAYLDYFSWSKGGMLNYVKNILPYLEKHYEIDLWGCSVDNKKLNPVIINGKNYEVNIFGQAKTTRKIVPNYLRAIIGIWKNSNKIENQNYDMLYFHSEPLCLFYCLRVAKRKSTIINHQHGLTLLESSANPFKLIQMAASKVSDINLINADLISIKEWENQCAIPFGKCIQALGQVDETVFFPENCYPDEKKEKFVTLGRITEAKNPIRVLECFKKYHNSYNKNSMLIFIGDGDQRTKLEKLVKRNKIEDYVEITGFISAEKVAEKLQNAKAMLMFSKGEGCSLAVAEAMACGVPVIGFDVPGVRGQIKNGETGRLLPYDSSEEEIAEAMEYCVRNESALKEKSLQEAGKYYSSVVADGIIRAIDGYIRER